MQATGASRLNRYIQSATLDGKPFSQTQLPSKKVHSRARLTFTMGPQPNKSWGT